MPEGDTIHKIANFLKPRIQSKPVSELRVAGRFPSRAVKGRAINDVVARGKHLFFVFDDDLTLRTHLGIYGSWHFYAMGEEWRKPRKQASLVMEVDGTVYVCFNAMELEWIRTPGVSERIMDSRLGPDLTAGSVDLDAVIERAREFLEPESPLVDLLLDQRIACGIGNVYKSEILFLSQLHPARTLGSIDDEQLSACFNLGSELLTRNLGGGMRVTRFEKDNAGRLWVYGRQDSDCLRCDGKVRYTRMGRHHRSTYWCDDCQPAD